MIEGEDYNQDTHNVENCDCGMGNFCPSSQGMNEGCERCHTSCPDCNVPEEYADEINIGCNTCNPNFNLELENLRMTIENTKYENVIACLNEKITTVKAVFTNKNSSETAYMYKINKELAKQLFVDDFVVGFGSKNNNFTILQITEIHKDCEIMPDSGASYTWIISKVDVDGFEANKEFERINVEQMKQARRTEIRQKFLLDSGLQEVKLIEVS